MFFNQKSWEFKFLPSDKGLVPVTYNSKMSFAGQLLFYKEKVQKRDKQSTPNWISLFFAVF